MKTVSGKIVSTKPVNLSKASNILSKFVNSDNGASQSVSVYLRRASTEFSDLVYFHKHHKLRKHRRKEEDSMKSDINPNKSEEDEIRALNPVKSDEKGTEKAEGVLRKKEKKKIADGDLGNESNGDIEENKDKKKKKRKSGDDEDSASLERKKKKRRRTEAVD